MADPADLTELYEAVALALRGPGPVEALRVLCRSTAGVLTLDGVAISTMTGTRNRETVCASDGVADELEELQFSLGEGPCFEAFHANRPVLVPDLEGNEETAPDSDAGSSWPIYSARVVERSPARAVFVFPLSIGSLGIGTMSGYRTTPGPLDTATLAHGVDLAQTAALVLLGDQDPTGVIARVRSDTSTGGPTTRPAGHQHVHIAAGMVAEQLHVSAQTGFDRMRGHAFVEGRLLVDVAEDVVTRRLHLDQPPVPPPRESGTS